jgi:hypothetical protein
LLRSRNRAHIGRLGQSIGDGHLFAARRYCAQELFGNISMQQDSAGGRAPLAGIRKTGSHCRANGFSKIGVIHHDQRVLSTQLQLHTRQVEPFLEFSADLRRAVNMIADPRIFDDHVDGRSQAGYAIEDAFGKPARSSCAMKTRTTA